MEENNIREKDTVYSYWNIHGVARYYYHTHHWKEHLFMWKGKVTIWNDILRPKKTETVTELAKEFGEYTFLREKKRL